MKLSICIPNFNYERYLGQTIQSVLTQDANVEVHVADNASTDGSVALLKEIADPRLSVSVNRLNVGFAANLDRACDGTTGERMMLLSSDDLMLPGALACYTRLVEAMGDRADRTLIAGAYDVIGDAEQLTGQQGADPRFFSAAIRDDHYSAAAGCDVLRISSADLLRASLKQMRIPMHWLTLCFPRAAYEAVEGFSNGRLYSPDKPFTWKLLSVSDDVLFVTKPYFQYRFHSNNQVAQQNRGGLLKHLVDQYVTTFDTSPEVLAHGGTDRQELAAAFVEQDIALRGLQKLAQGNRVEARRGVDFGRAAYPALVRSNTKVWALRLLLALGPIGTIVARRLYDRALAHFAATPAAPA